MKLLPVVLTGGRSERFGRDKLREPWGSGMLVDAPVGALRAVFGAPVVLCGACHADVAVRGDLMLADRRPGGGPIGGIVAALEHPLGADGVFVLAGDLGYVTESEVRAILTATEGDAASWAVLADSGRIEPCVGVYRQRARRALEEQMACGRGSLHDALPASRVTRVRIDAAKLRNVNTPEDVVGPTGAA